MSRFSLIMCWVVVLMCLHTCLRVCEANADIEVIGGGLTYHLLDSGNAPKYSNQVSKDGRLIDNPVLGVSVTDHYFMLFKSLTAFAGQNSVGGPILGGMYEEGFEVRGWQFGPALGAYSQESHNFTDRSIQSFRLVNYRGMDVVPVLGFAVNYRLTLTDSVYLKLNNVISPLITNTTLSLGYAY